MNFIQTYLNLVTKNEIKCVSPHLTLYLGVQINLFLMYQSMPMLCKMYNDGKLSIQNHYLSDPLVHIGVNGSSTQREVVTVVPLLLLDNTL